MIDHVPGKRTKQRGGALNVTRMRQDAEQRWVGRAVGMAGGDRGSTRTWGCEVAGNWNSAVTSACIFL